MPTKVCTLQGPQREIQVPGAHLGGEAGARGQLNSTNSTELGKGKAFAGGRLRSPLCSHCSDPHPPIAQVRAGPESRH